MITTTNTTTHKPTSSNNNEPSTGENLAVGLATLLGHTFRGVTRAAREAVWVVRTLPHLIFLLTALLLAALWFGSWWQASGPTLGLVGLLTYPRTSPARWARVTDSALAHHYRTTWKTTAADIGLSVPDRSRPDSLAVLVPKLRKASARDGAVTLRLELRSGLTLNAVEAAVPALQAHVGAHSARVVPDGPSFVNLVLTHRDAVGHVVELPEVAPRPDATTGLQVAPAVELRGGKLPRLTIGTMATGTPWEFNPCIHTLTAGCPGAGKGSVMWSILAALAPLVDAGYVRLIGIDLKGGMEPAWAKGLFARLVTTKDEAVTLVEHLADEVQATAHRLAGNTREHHVTRDHPYTILVIDELTLLTSFNRDTQLRGRFEAAMGVYLSQGRAPGYSCLAFMQDPRRDSVPHRGLFGQAIALRLKESSETVMVLGESASIMGPAHHIPISTPGVAYTIDETGLVLKARAYKVTDNHLRTLAARYTTNHHLTPDTPTVEPTGNLLDTPPPAASDYSHLWGQPHTTTHPASPPVAAPGGGPSPARPSTAAPSSRPRRAARKPRTPRTPRTNNN